MPTYLVETTARPGVLYEVDQDEYDRLSAVGLLVGGPVEPSGPGVFDAEVAAVVSDAQSATHAAVVAAAATGGWTAVDASDTVKGIVELATTAETTTGTDATRAVTPAGVKAVADAASTADRARANHTGTQSLDTTTDSATRLAMTAAERTKLAGVATGATANATAYTKRTITADYTLVLADGTDIVLHCTATTGVTITVPSDTAVALPQETPIPWRQSGTGQITFAAGTGATPLLSRGSASKSAGQYAEGLLTKIAANTWLLSGDITA